MAQQAQLWGLPDKKGKTTPPKCFNIASATENPSIDTILSLFISISINFISIYIYLSSSFS